MIPNLTIYDYVSTIHTEFNALHQYLRNTTLCICCFGKSFQRVQTQEDNCVGCLSEIAKLISYTVFSAMFELRYM